MLHSSSSSYVAPTDEIDVTIYCDQQTQTEHDNGAAKKIYRSFGTQTKPICVKDFACQAVRNFNKADKKTQVFPKMSSKDCQVEFSSKHIVYSC